MQKFTNQELKQHILQDFHLNEDDILSIFSYGSVVYGTTNSKSDYDFIIVSKNLDKDDIVKSDNNINATLYSKESFDKLLIQHKIFALECMFLPQSLILKNNAKYNFSIDLAKLRSYISEKSSHSFVKAKKKFEVIQDKDVYVGKKSLFHSLRIIDFGTQLAKFNKITDYSSSNKYWIDIFNNQSNNWEDYKIIYQPIYNNLMTEFRKLAPK